MTSPRRLLDTASTSGELSRALRAAPVEPDPQELQAMASRLSAALGVPLTPSTTAPIPAPVAVALAGKASGGIVSLGAWVLGGVVLGVALSGVGALATSAPDNATPSAVVAQVLPPSAQTAAAKTEATPDPVTVETVGGVPVVASPSRRVASSEQAAATESTTVEPAVTEAVVLEPRESELSLLRRAQAAVTSNPARALALSALHGQAFPEGLLAQEREVIAIDALSRMGRTNEARVRAQSFAQRYPGSAHAPRLRAVLGETGLK